MNTIDLLRPMPSLAEFNGTDAEFVVMLDERRKAIAATIGMTLPELHDLGPTRARTLLEETFGSEKY